MGGAARPLSPCPFSEKDLRSADERNDIPIVICLDIPSFQERIASRPMTGVPFGGMRTASSVINVT